MEEKLLPCPFELVEKDIGHQVYLDRELMQITCSCGARGPIMAHTSATAIRGWNNRTEARAEALRDAADRAEEYIKTTLWRDIEYDRENYDIEFDELRAAITGDQP
jgi:predicted NBD/HSP70 family sugar kinase